MSVNNNIIKFSCLKKYLSVHFDYFISVNDHLLIDINSLKNDSDSFYNLNVRLFLFSSYFSEISVYLNQIKPFLDLADSHIKDLTVDQREILVKFSLFLIRFWCDGLKIFANYMHISNNYAVEQSYFKLISFWLEIPNFLNFLQPFLSIPSVNITESGFYNIYLFLVNSDSIFYIFTLWYSHEIDQKPYKGLFNYKLAFNEWLFIIWKGIPESFLYYMYILLKESNKNFTFKVEKLYKDADGEPLE